MQVARELQIKVTLAATELVQTKEVAAAAVLVEQAEMQLLALAVMAVLVFHQTLLAPP